MKFRSKPKTIEAYQITMDLLERCLFDGEAYPKGLTCSSCHAHPVGRQIYHWFGNVVTIHGQKTKVTIGDWIITEPDGEHFYPCKPNIFENNYEKID